MRTQALEGNFDRVGKTGDSILPHAQTEAFNLLGNLRASKVSESTNNTAYTNGDAFEIVDQKESPAGKASPATNSEQPDWMHLKKFPQVDEYKTQTDQSQRGGQRPEPPTPVDPRVAQ